MDVAKYVAKYLNSPIGTICYNSEKVLTTILEKENIEGLTSIILKLSQKSLKPTKDQMALDYQWLEYISLYLNQASSNSTFAKLFLNDFNTALENTSYLTGQTMSVADIAAFYALFPIIVGFTVPERECYVNLCRWMKHIQSQPRVCSNLKPLQLDAINLTVLAPAVH